jgi:cyclophilin family peptidyl-prolyl cis-trans isomerase
MKSIKYSFIALALLAFTSVGFAQDAGKAPVAKAKKEKKAKPAKDTGPDLIMHTTQGDIMIKLYAEKVPCTVGSFVSLCETHFFDSTLFHRVIPNFMIQGGDPLSKGAKAGVPLGTAGPGYTFEDEFDASLKHDKKGLLSMANSGPNTNGSQFFITAVATPWLDNKHSIFGEVTSGLDVVDKIISQKRNRMDRPDEDQMIKSIDIVKVKKLKKRIAAAKKLQGKTCPTKPYADKK